MKTTWLFFCLVVGLGAALLGARTPAPVASLGAFDRFSAERAFRDVGVIGQKPHPVGSAEHARVQAYLVERLTKLGLDPAVQKTVGQSQALGRFAVAAPVANLVAVLPGKNRQLPALGLMAHYDSVPHSPGAGDDAAGVATVLEIARILKNGPPPERDVVFVLTDGEELGLLGAEAFFDHHPLAKHLGMVLNFESRGRSGLTMMFEAGPQSGALISRFAQTAIRPAALSLSDAVYGQMPNGTDFSVAKAHGLMGLNFAFIGGEDAYHTPFATPDRLDWGSVQHMGDSALPVARSLAADPNVLDRVENPVYFDLLGWVVVQYPAFAGWGALALAAFLTMLALASGRTSDGFAVFKGVFGCALFVLMPILILRPVGRALALVDHVQRVPAYPFILPACLLLTVASAMLSARRLRTARARLLLSAIVLVAGAACNVGGFDPISLALAAAALFSIWAAGGRPLDVADLWRSGLVFSLVMAGVAQIYFPSASILIVWPLAAGAALAAILFSVQSGRLDGFPTQICCGAALALVMAPIGGVGNFLFDAVGVDVPAALALPVLMAIPVAAPLLASAGTERTATETGVLLFFVGGVLLGCVRLFWPLDAHPVPSIVLHVQDMNAGKAYRVAPLAGLDPWAANALADGGWPAKRGILTGEGDAPVWFAPSTPAHLPKPSLTVERKAGRLVVTAKASPGDASQEVTVRSSARLTHSYLNGRALSGAVEPGSPQSVLRYVPDSNGTVWTFDAPRRARIEVRLKVRRAAWPDSVSPPPAYGSGIMPFGPSGNTDRILQTKTAW